MATVQMVRTVLLLICVLVVGTPARAQTDTPPALAGLAGDYFPIDSVSTEGRYHIYVRYPEGYDPADERLYPTVYLLDGDSLFPMLAPTQLFLHYDEALPEAIVVGIAYGSFDPAINRRDRDYRGHAVGLFDWFLEVELIPEIERRYRSDPNRRVLVGQSLGGGYVVHSALTHPDLFWGRIASNPAFGTDPAWAYEAPGEASRNDLGLVVISGSRDRQPYRDGALEWFEHWEGRESPWRLNTMTLDGGTHAASIGQVYRTGMLWLFENSETPAQP